MLNLSLLLSIALMSGNALAATIALIGDSISTGGASHSALAFDIDRMEGVISGRTPVGVDQATADFLSAEGIPGPYTDVERLGLSPREFTHPLVWMFNNFVTSMSTQFLDTEEFSWGYLLGRMRGDNTIIAARDGEKSLHARQQIDRLLDNAPDASIDHVFVFFTGNDICAPHSSLVTSKEDYLANINDAVRYLIRNAKPKPTGGITQVWLLDPLGVSQIATSPAILNKGSELQGRSVRSAREGPRRQSDP
jgi:lysophospholipase L1-like esterase